MVSLEFMPQLLMVDNLSNVLITARPTGVSCPRRQALHIKFETEA